MLKICLNVKVRKIIAINENFAVRMLAEELNLSYCTIYTILTDDLDKRKVFARFVPHQLNLPSHKTKKVNEFLMKKQVDRSKRCIDSNGTYSK